MYKIKKQEKRTAKQCFALLKQKLLEFARSQPKLKIKKISNQRVIFPNPPVFKSLNNQQLGQSTVSLKQLSSHPTAKYPFYFQNFKPTITDQLLNLFNPRCILPINDRLRYGKPNCIAVFNEQSVAIGTDLGYIALISSLYPLKYKIHQIFKDSPVISLDLYEKTIVCCSATGQFVILEIQLEEVKKICQIVCSPALSIKIIRFHEELVILICCLDGSIQRVRIKKWMIITKAELKLLFKEKLFCQKLKVMNRKTQLEYFTKSEFRDVVFFAAISARNAFVFSYYPPEEKIQKLYAFANMGNVGDKSSGIVQFLYGPFMPPEEKGLVLCVAFEDRMYYIRIEQSSVDMIIDNYIQIQGRLNFVPSKRMKCSSSIISIEAYGTDGLFIIVTKIGIVYYCHTSNFITIEKFTQIGQNKKLMLETAQDIKHLDTKQQIPSLKGMYLYTSSVAIIKGGVLLITQKEIMLCELLDSMALHQRLGMSQNLLLLYYIILLKQCDSLYLKRPESFQGLDTEFPRSNPEEKQALLQYYYLVDVEPPPDFATNEQLCQLLLPFILKHQLSNLSEEQTDILVQYWEKRNPLLIEEIILSGVNKGWEIAIKNAWIRSLIKMVQMGAEYDFPVLKLYGYVVLYQDKDQELTKKYAVQIIKYISLGISRQLKNDVEDQEYESMIQLFVKILFEKDLFDVLAKVKPKKMITLLTKLFEKTTKKCLDDMALSTLVLQCNRKYEQLVMNEGSISEILFSHTFQTFLDMYPEDKQIQRYLVIQQAILLHDWTFQLKQNRVYEIIIKLLSDYDTLEKMRVLPIYKGKHKEQIELDIQEFILRIIEYLESNYCFKEDKRWNLVELADKCSAFDYVAVQLMSPANKFESIFAKFLNSQNSLVRQKLFDWMVATMKKCQLGDKKVLDEFNRVSLSKVRFYMQINKQKTKQFIQQYYKNSEKKLINKIEEYPQLQLQYVQLVIQDSEQVEEYILNLHISLLCRLNPSRIIPVLEHNTTDDRIKYNLKEALELCQEYKHQEAVIYINERVGEIYSSISRHLQVFTEEWQKYKKDRKQKRQVAKAPSRTFTVQQLREIVRQKPDSRDKQKDSEAILYDHLEYMLELIHKQPKLPSYYQLYNLIVTTFMKLYIMEQQQSRSVINKGDQTFMNKISDLIGVLVLDLAKQGNIDFLIEEVINKYVEMHFREMKKYFHNTYKIIHQNLTLLKNISEVAKRYLIDFNMDTRKGMIKSIAAEARCGLCNGVLTDEAEGLLFTCGHIFHMGCTISQDESDYCGQCVFVNPIGAMVEEPELNLNQYLKDRAYRLQNQIQKQQQLKQKQVEAKQMTVKQKRLNKLKIYDKRQQQLIIQAQTVQLRLQLRQTID